MGGMMRQMSTQQNSMGEMVGFEELGRLAANMGRMGMDQGVRSAREFRDRFKQMVGTLKTIAEDMGTSLEEAQKMMVGMRSSGVFGNRNQGIMAGAIRQTAMGSGLAVSEVTGMMGVGSQISRMVGGRGYAGAVGGLRTIGQIGMAQQLGITSEEDIYNATGLTGAEGRRAMATQQMETSASFLKSSLGRRIVASMAGAKGQLNEESVARYMEGGVGTGETMQMAGQNLGRVGRADFIRNEGRLRGEIMGRFGGLMPAIAMSGWLSQRGIDPNSDMASIFAQRRLGMGSDEADQMMQLVKNLPMIMREQRLAGGEGDIQRAVGISREQSGLQGVKHKFEQAKSKMDAYIQQAGSDFMSYASDRLDRVINAVTGQTAKFVEKDLTRQYARAMGGSTSAMTEYFGYGGLAGDRSFNYQKSGNRFIDNYGVGGGRGGLEALGGAVKDSLPFLQGATNLAGDMLPGSSYIRQGVLGLLKGAGIKSVSELGDDRKNRKYAGRGLAGLYEGAKFRPMAGMTEEGLQQWEAEDRLGSASALSGAGLTEQQIYGVEGSGQSLLAKLNPANMFLGMRQRAELGGKFADADKYRQLSSAREWGAKNADRLRTATLYGAIGGNTVKERVASYKDFIADNGGWKTAQQLGKAESLEEQTAFLGSMLQGAGGNALGNEAAYLRGLSGGGTGNDRFLSLEGQFRTVEARQEAIGDFMLKGAGGLASKETWGSKEKKKLGEMMDNNNELFTQLMSKDSAVQRNATATNERAIEKLQRSIALEGLAPADKADANIELKARQMAGIAGQVSSGIERGVLSPSEVIADVANRTGRTVEEVTNTTSNVGGYLSAGQSDRVRKAAAYFGDKAREKLGPEGKLAGGMVRRGEGGKLEFTSKEPLGATTRELLATMQIGTELEATMGMGDSAQQDLNKIAARQVLSKQETIMMGGMSTAEANKFAGELRAGGDFAKASEVTTKNRLTKTFEKGGAGVMSEWAKAMGGELKTDKLWRKGKKGMEMASAEEKTEMYFQSIGLTKETAGTSYGDVLKQAQLARDISVGPKAGRGEKVTDLVHGLEGAQIGVGADVKNKNLESDKANNPLMAQLASSLETIVTNTAPVKDVVTGVNLIPGAILEAAKTKVDPEAPK
jgi:hypothetical protein